MVFSNPKVVRRIADGFVPVALKAAQVDRPPPGVEGALYARIRKTRPAPQGICVVNSAGQVLAWSLSFDDKKSIGDFLDAAEKWYKQFPDAAKPVTARRFLRYPSHPLPDIENVRRPAEIPSQHPAGDRCPAQKTVGKDTLAGRVIGRALDKNGQPVADTLRQEHYMEAKFELPVALHQKFAEAVEKDDGKRFLLPHEFGRGLVAPAYLGQLDVNPLGNTPGSRNVSRGWEFHGARVGSEEKDVTRIRVTGRSHLEGGPSNQGAPRSDGRVWEHAVSLDWQGYVDLKENRIIRLEMLASGRERLRWGNAALALTNEPNAAHLMAGHPIDLDCKVRYGLQAGGSLVLRQED